MKIPYSKKASMNVRTMIRASVPWIFGSFHMDDEKIAIKYFFFTKEYSYDDVNSVRSADYYLVLGFDKAAFEIRLNDADEICDYIKKRCKK